MRQSSENSKFIIFLLQSDWYSIFAVNMVEFEDELQP